MKLPEFKYCIYLGILLTAVAAANAAVEVKTRASLKQAVGIELQDGTFSITTNTLSFGRADLEYFSGGILEAPPFTFSAIPGTQRLLLFDQTSGREYIIDSGHIGENNGTVYLNYADIMATTNTITSDIFSSINAFAVGEVSLNFPITAPAPPPDLTWCPTNLGPSIDVQLANIDFVQQRDREPGVRVSLTMATTLANVGTNDVIWQWSINPPGPYHPLIGQHPFAVFHLYRLKDGSFRQIGKSDVKHAFYSANTSCNCPGAQVIFAGCRDVYGIMSNSDPFFFTPRDEVHIFSGSWTSLGSYFDVTDEEPVPDDYRSRTNWPDVFTHRLVVPEAMLSDTNADYYVESWYAVQGDTNNYNNIGYRKVTPVLQGSAWVFSINTTITNGPAIDVFIPRDDASAFTHHKVLDTQEGLVHLAVNVVPLGSGMYRFGYALMNLNFDRRLKTFSIPVSPSAMITNVQFGDSDINTTNDWIMSVTNDTLRWTSADTNGLIWGSMLEFTFEADVPPSPFQANVSALQPGVTNEYTIDSLVPGVRISAINGSDSAQLIWSSVSGAVYGVESTAGTLLPVWTNTGMVVTGTAAGASMIDTNVDAESKYYRLNLLSVP